MMKWRRSWTLLCVLLSLTLAHAWAQVATTAVQDTVYRADGTAATGSVVLSWNAFTTAQGASVPAGTTSVTLGAGGSLAVSLAPNAGATPMGSYYTAIYHLDDGSTSREYWVVPVLPAGSGAVTLSAIRNSVLPLSVAMQTVSKTYVDTAIATSPISAARLPVFGASGSAHSPGAVPDPGAVAGVTRFLREDGTFAVPPAGSGGSSGAASGAAGGDLSGTYPNPTVSSVHATAGTMDGVTIGATTAAAGTFTTIAGTSAVFTGPGGGGAVTPLNVTSSSTNATYFCVSNTSPGAHQYCPFSLGSVNGPPVFGVQDNTAGVVLSGNGINPGGSPFYQVPANGVYGFASGAVYNTYPDTGFTRLSAGAVALGNGTLGSTTGSLTLQQITVTALAGTGNAYACLDATGKLYRSAAVCD